jgi:hypothetical protein
MNKSVNLLDRFTIKKIILFIIDRQGAERVFGRTWHR